VTVIDVTAGLAESNGSLPPGGWLKVICGVTACTPGSAPGPKMSMGELYLFIPQILRGVSYFCCWFSLDYASADVNGLCNLITASSKTINMKPYLSSQAQPSACCGTF